MSAKIQLTTSPNDGIEMQCQQTLGPKRDDTWQPVDSCWSSYTRYNQSRDCDKIQMMKSTAQAPTPTVNPCKNLQGWGVRLTGKDMTAARATGPRCLMKNFVAVFQHVSLCDFYMKKSFNQVFMQKSVFTRPHRSLRIQADETTCLKWFRKRNETCHHKTFKSDFDCFCTDLSSWVQTKLRPSTHLQLMSCPLNAQVHENDIWATCCFEWVAKQKSKWAFRTTDLWTVHPSQTQEHPPTAHLDLWTEHQSQRKHTYIKVYKRWLQICDIV